MRFILDCSVAISWCLLDEDNDYANAIYTKSIPLKIQTENF